MKIIFSGLEDSGKSLRLAQTAANLVHRNSAWYVQQIKYYKKHGAMAFLKEYKIERPKPRVIKSNLKFSEVFYEYATKEMGVPIMYWKDLDQILYEDDCDIIMDEVGRYFNARKWQDLSTDALGWLTQSSKRGVEIYGAAQDFSQVDVNFRRLVGGRGGLFHIRKIMGSRRPSATKPPVKKIWGVCTMDELDPIGYDSATSLFKHKSIFPTVFFITRQYCEIFDTKQKIAQGIPPKLRHTMQLCEQATCSFTRTSHA